MKKENYKNYFSMKDIIKQLKLWPIDKPITVFQMNPKGLDHVHVIYGIDHIDFREEVMCEDLLILLKPSSGNNEISDILEHIQERIKFSRLYKTEVFTTKAKKKVLGGIISGNAIYIFKKKRWLFIFF